jgi:hypothetical protein
VEGEEKLRIATKSVFAFEALKKVSPFENQVLLTKKLRRRKIL